jgi:hypothetical protein
MLRGNVLPPNMTTSLLTGTQVQLFGIDAGQTYTGGGTYSIQSINPNINVSSFYKEYKVMTVRATWLPAVSPGDIGANARVYITHDTNPEHIQTVIANSISQNLSVIKSDRNMRYFNAWERVTFTFQIPLRRKMFDQNTNCAINDVNVVNRSLQGLFVTGCDGGPVAGPTAVGGWVFDPVIMLQGQTLVAT